MPTYTLIITCGSLGSESSMVSKLEFRRQSEHMDLAQLVVIRRADWLVAGSAAIVADHEAGDIHGFEVP